MKPLSQDKNMSHIQTSTVGEEDTSSVVHAQSPDYKSSASPERKPKKKDHFESKKKSKKSSKKIQDESESESESESDKKKSKKKPKKKFSSDESSNDSDASHGSETASLRAKDMIQWIETYTDGALRDKIDPKRATIASKSNSKNKEVYDAIIYKFATPMSVELRDCTTTVSKQYGHKVCYKGAPTESLLLAIYNLYEYVQSECDKHAQSLKKFFDQYPLHVLGSRQDLSNLTYYVDILIKNLPKPSWEDGLSRDDIDFESIPARDNGVKFKWPFIQSHSTVAAMITGVKIDRKRKTITISFELRKIVAQQYKESKEMLNGRMVTTVPFLQSTEKKKSKKKHKPVTSSSESSSSSSEQETSDDESKKKKKTKKASK